MSSDILEFEWGIKRGMGGKTKDVQFYASFNFDGVEYKLADCVYMWKDDEPEPFVGKIVKIWQDRSRRVKILWFFKPSEILNYLGGIQTKENELFLASGESAGLANVNPLEAIAGKCNVVCISKDDRNPQPTKEELEAADYVFYRTFDVDRLIVSETIPEKIPQIDIKLVFNQRLVGKQPRVSNETELLPKNEVSVAREENGGRVNSPKPSEDKSNAAQKGNTERNICFPKSHDGGEMNSMPFKKPKISKDDNDKKLKVQSGDIPSQNTVEEKKSKIPLNVSSDLVRKPSKMETDVSNHQIKGKSKFPEELYGKEKEVLPVKRKLDEKVERPVSSKKPKASDHTLNEPSNPTRGFTEVNRKPDADRSRWFKELPWEEKMENAHRQGALVLLENLDPLYSSSDVEDIIWHGFKESCTAKIVYCATNCSKLGQALAVFRTKEIAEKVVTRLENGCLMLSNGSPLIASFGSPRVPGKETLVGHFGIDKLAVQLSREKKEAVSTSHCSQPNSIEYEFAMDWCLLQDRYNLSRRLLKKQHAEELKKALADLKTKFPCN